MPSPAGRRHALTALWSTLRRLRADATVLDEQDVVESLRRAASRSWWLRPLTYLDLVLDALVRGVVLLVTTLRLAASEILPAVWIGAITWSWRVHSSGRLPLAPVEGPLLGLVVVGVVSANVLAYWCNAVIAFSLTQHDPGDLRSATRAARAHARPIVTGAFLLGVVHALVSTVAARSGQGTFTLLMGAMALLQMSAIVALPAIVVGQRARRHRSLKERAGVLALTGSLTLIALLPGLVLTRLGVVALDAHLVLLGALLLVAGILVQIAGTSSVHTVLLTIRFAELGIGPRPASLGHGA
jgi:hypothetical protein